MSKEHEHDWYPSFIAEMNGPDGDPWVAVRFACRKDDCEKAWFAVVVGEEL